MVGLVREDFPQEVVFEARTLGLPGSGMQAGRPQAQGAGPAGWAESQCVPEAQWSAGAGRPQGWACPVGSRLSLPGQTGGEESAAAAGCAEVSGVPARPPSLLSDSLARPRPALGSEQPSGQ